MGITFYRNFEEMVDAAQSSIDSYGHYFAEKRPLTCEKEKEWLQKLLDILKEEKYATIQADNGRPVDVQAIAHTGTYASFFDVYNHINMFNFEIDPVVTEDCKNHYSNTFDYEEVYKETKH